MTDYFTAQLSDELVANFILSAAEPRYGLINQAVAAGVRIGRTLGKAEGLEPLDDGLRAVVAGALDIVLKRDPSMGGLIFNLRRLDEWLQRYPARGLPIELPQTDPSL